MKILVTGSCGLIGSEAVEYFDSLGHTIVGVDNNMRMEFFGEAGDTSWNLHRIAHKAKNFSHEAIDIRDRESLYYHVFSKHGKFDVVIHCAAQPSHDKAKEIPLIDFEVNALGTMNMLELTRQNNPEAVFIFMSTNKVYGDSPNDLPLIEQETRFDYATQADWNGIREDCRIDRSTHSVFGASKVAADIMTQEYGRYFGLKTVVFRGGCLTGPNHSGVALHGFLSYMVKCAVADKTYVIYGYKGKQVRDNLHSYDVVRAIEAVINKPPTPGSVYNLGGGRENSLSVMEAKGKIETLLDKHMLWDYIDTNRVGDHICYITDMIKFKSDYPEWKITKSTDKMLIEIIQSENQRLWWNGVSETGGSEENFNHALTPTSVVLDIGGYRGDFADKIYEKTNAHIHIFEPIEEFYSACKYRFRNNKKITIHAYGLSNKTGSMSIAKMEAASSLYSTGNTNESIKLVDIASESLLSGKVDLVSINVEGSEYPILRRMIETGIIKNCVNVQVQFHTSYPNMETEYIEIRKLLSKTHKITYCYPFVWENWMLK